MKYVVYLDVGDAKDKQEWTHDTDGVGGVLSWYLFYWFRISVAARLLSQLLPFLFSGLCIYYWVFFPVLIVSTIFLVKKIIGICNL